MYQFDRIKLIIWDLDETFWSGTLSEERVAVPEENKRLILQLTDKGIVNSICSKNDWEPVKQELEKQKLLEYFVFPSVDWESKGPRIKQLIRDMQLRPANVLFIDDNSSNREEVRYFCPEIMVDGPEIISKLVIDVRNCKKEDLEHKRLKQYQILEEKHYKKSQFNSNEEFLMESNIKLDFGSDCIEQKDRIIDLLMRSNQLNFTKFRCSEEEYIAICKDGSVKCGYVSVSDRFGDYGIVGFYALKDSRLIHFTFSCRVLGMGIEQYVYNLLERPSLEIVGEVISNLESTEIPKWINQDKEIEKDSKMDIEGLQKHMVLVKGPCDLFQIYPYIAQTELFDTEFTYVVEGGLTIESTGHTTHIVESGRLSDTQKKLVLSEVPFSDAGMYNDSIFKNHYKVVFISILQDANLGVYRRKETGEKIAFLEYIHPITESSSWSGLLSGKYNCGGFQFTEEILQDFSEKYEFMGRNTPKQVVENLTYIRSKLQPDCTLVIMLGGELYYEKNTFEAYKYRHLVHKEMNDSVRKFAENVQGVRLLDVNKYLIDQSSFYDHFNHYVKPVYYNLAKEMVDIINDCIGTQIRETAKWKMVQIRLKEILAPVYYYFRKRLRKS